ncbi:FAD-binding protein [Streptomyces sp. GTA36]
MTTAHTPNLFALSEIRGPVLRPDDEAYMTEVTGFNLSPRHTPDIVIGATGTDDIVAALRWATATGTPVSVQATGHGANFPIVDGLLINTSRMTDVRIDPAERTATVSAGAKWRDVLEAAAPHGLAALNGSSTDVGVIGYTLGGGLPVLGRTYGYASDLVRSFQVVTPDGVLHETDATREPDLFRALRGGKGNVGVVTSLVTELIPLTRILGGAIYYAGTDAEAVLNAYASWTPTLPEEMCTAFSLLRLPPLPQIPEPLRGGFWSRIAVAWTGDPTEGERLLTPIREAAPAVIDTIAPMDYTAVDQIYAEPEDPLPARESCALLNDLTPEAIDTFLNEVGPTARNCPPTPGRTAPHGRRTVPPGPRTGHGLRPRRHVLPGIGGNPPRPRNRKSSRTSHNSPTTGHDPLRHRPHHGQHPRHPWHRSRQSQSLDPRGLRTPPKNQGHPRPVKPAPLRPHSAPGGMTKPTPPRRPHPQAAPDDAKERAVPVRRKSAA